MFCISYFVFCHEAGCNIATPVMMMMMAMMMMMTMMRKLVKFFHFLFQILMLYLVSILKEAEVQESVRKNTMQCLKQILLKRIDNVFHNIFY